MIAYYTHRSTPRVQMIAYYTSEYPESLTTTRLTLRYPLRNTTRIICQLPWIAKHLCRSPGIRLVASIALNSLLSYIFLLRFVCKQSSICRILNSNSVVGNENTHTFVRRKIERSRERSIAVGVFSFARSFLDQQECTTFARKHNPIVVTSLEVTEVPCYPGRIKSRSFGVGWPKMIPRRSKRHSKFNFCDVETPTGSLNESFPRRGAYAEPSRELSTRPDETAVLLLFHLGRWKIDVLLGGKVLRAIEKHFRPFVEIQRQWLGGSLLRNRQIKNERRAARNPSNFRARSCPLGR